MGTVHNDSWALVAAAQRGENEAFGELYRQHVAAVRRFLRFRTADRDLVDDLTSETFVRAMCNIRSVADRGQELDAWLFTIARNALLDQRKRAYVRREVAVGEFEQHLHPVNDLDTDHIDILPPKHELLRCMDTLTNEQRQCIVLRTLEGKSVKTTATAMNRSPEAVRALHHRAIRQLRTQLVHVMSISAAAVA